MGFGQVVLRAAGLDVAMLGRSHPEIAETLAPSMERVCAQLQQYSGQVNGFSAIGTPEAMREIAATAAQLADSMEALRSEVAEATASLIGPPARPGKPPLQPTWR